MGSKDYIAAIEDDDSEESENWGLKTSNFYFGSVHACSLLAIPWKFNPLEIVTHRIVNYFLLQIVPSIYNYWEASFLATVPTKFNHSLQLGDTVYLIIGTQQGSQYYRIGTLWNYL